MLTGREVNTMRNITMSGKIANFGKVYREAEGEKSAFCVVFLNMSLDRKDEATGYTATVPVKVIANGYWAERLNSFAVGEMVYVSGKLDKDSDYTNAEGELVRGGLMVKCEMIDNWAAEGNVESSAKAPAKPAKAAPAKPAAKGKPAMPRKPKMA